jgi:hypothetical protein
VKLAGVGLGVGVGAEIGLLVDLTPPFAFDTISSMPVKLIWVNKSLATFIEKSNISEETSAGHVISLFVLGSISWTNSPVFKFISFAVLSEI